MIRMSRPSKSEDDSAFVLLDHLQITIRSKVTQSMEKHGIKLDTSVDIQYTSTDGESKRLEDDNNDDGGGGEEGG